MEKIILKITELKTIIGVINDGNVVALPTDTVYGLVCKLNDGEAIKKIYKIKDRDEDKALPVLVASWEQAERLGHFNQELKSYLDSHFLKGQVTFIVPRQKNLDVLPYWIGKETIALRITNSELLQNIINQTGPLIATSCNLSGEPPLATAKEISLKLPNLKYIVDGLVNGKSSTIYDAILKKTVRY